MDGDRQVAKRESKILDLADAIAQYVSKQDTLGIGGLHSNNSPMALVRETIRQDRHGLHLIPNVSAGMPADLLIGAGMVDSAVVCYIGLEDLGLAQNFRRAAERGEIQVEEADEPYLIGGLTAGAADQPFFALPKGHAAIDDTKLNPRFMTVVDPYSKEEMYVCPAIQPDVALIHASQCDQFGNARLPGSVVGDYLLARASTRVIVSTEEVISVEETRRCPDRTTIPGFMVDAVVWSPYGAHPTSCHGQYLADTEALRDYRDANVVDYIRDNVLGVSHWDYLENFGAERLLRLRQDGRLLEMA